MRCALARVVAGEVLYDEREDTELEVVEVFPERGVVEVLVDDGSEFRDLVEMLAALRAGQLVHVDDDDATELRDDDGDDESEQELDDDERD